MFTFESIKDLRWQNKEKSYFSCLVKWSEYLEYFSTGVSASDPYPHIQLLWENATKGSYGYIEDYKLEEFANDNTRNFPTLPSGQIPLVIF